MGPTAKPGVKAAVGVWEPSGDALSRALDALLRLQGGSEGGAAGQQGATLGVLPEPGTPPLPAWLAQAQEGGSKGWTASAAPLSQCTSLCSTLGQQASAVNVVDVQSLGGAGTCTTRCNVRTGVSEFSHIWGHQA